MTLVVVVHIYHILYDVGVFIFRHGCFIAVALRAMLSVALATFVHYLASIQGGSVSPYTVTSGAGGSGRKRISNALSRELGAETRTQLIVKLVNSFTGILNIVPAN